MYQRHETIQQEAGAGGRAPLWHRAAAALVKGALAAVILAVAATLAQSIMDAAPVAERGGAERLARLVEVVEAREAEAGPSIRAWGTVEPVRRLVLRTEVAGTVERLAPELTPGGRIAEGEVLIALSDREARLAIAEAEAEIARIDAQIALEAGQQSRARRDLERTPVRRDLTEEQRALILREPQQAELEAQRAAALARRDAAEIALGKMVMRAPFDALVESEQLAKGMVVMAGAEVARLVGTERFRVVLAVPPAALAWIDADGGQEVRLTQPRVWPEGASRSGRIVRLEPGLSETGRMAELVAEIDDPLGAGPGAPRLLIGALLEARIEAPPVPGAVAIDRAWLRDGDTVWIMDAEGRLEIRPVEIAWRGSGEVLVSAGIAPGDRVVTTNLATVAEGMALRLAEGGDGAEG